MAAGECDQVVCGSEPARSRQAGCEAHADGPPARPPAERHLIATVSHELRNPIAAISGYTQLLRRRRAYDEELVDSILTLTERATRLLDDLLDPHSLTREDPDLRFAHVDIVAAVRASVDETRVLTDEHAISCESDPGPLMVLCDPDRISQALRNLLTNAVKYSPGGGEIAVTIKRAGSTVCISVADHGVGIPPEALARIFDPYYRVGGAQGRAGGLGLGLPIARRLIEAHGGSLAVDSRPGEGSTFTVTLWLTEPLPDATLPRASLPDDTRSAADAARHGTERPALAAAGAR
jgi:signal transduction histidine kinase